MSPSAVQPPLSICHVITRMIIGGAQENTLLTVRGQLENGHRVVLLTGPTTGPEGKLLAGGVLPGLELVEEPMLRRAVNPLADWLAYRRLKAFFAARRFDIVHTHSSKGGIVGRLAATAAASPLVVHTVHGQPFHPYQSAWQNRLYIAAERWAGRRCHHIFAVAQAMIDQCVAAGIAPREKYSVVYSGMELAAFAAARPSPELRARLGLPADVPVIGKIARLFELKGHDYLLAAAPAVVAEFPNVRFLLVGDGLLRERLAAQAAALGLADNIVFAGLVPPAEVPNYIALMDVVAHLSLREGLPRTVVQALAAGKPAVGFALDGTPEVIVDGETGRLCPPQNAAAVANALLELLRNPQQARSMGAAGQRRVAERFDWRHMVDCLEQAYARLRREKGIGDVEW